MNTAHLARCEVALVTGTTVTIETLTQFLGQTKPVLFHGVRWREQRSCLGWSGSVQ